VPSNSEPVEHTFHWHWYFHNSIRYAPNGQPAQWSIYLDSRPATSPQGSFCPLLVGAVDNDDLVQDADKGLRSCVPSNNYAIDKFFIMNFLHTARAVILGSSFVFVFQLPFSLKHFWQFAGVVVLLSVVVLALSSALIHTTTSEGFYFTFAALALAVSILTLLAVPPLYVGLPPHSRSSANIPHARGSIVSDHVRTGFVAWKVVVELIVIGM